MEICSWLELLQEFYFEGQVMVEIQAQLNNSKGAKLCTYEPENLECKYNAVRTQFR